MNTDMEKFLARGKRISALEIEMEALKREAEALRAEGDETGAARIERRGAELAKRLEAENEGIRKFLGDSKAEAVLNEQANRCWNKEVDILMQPRCSLLEAWLKNYIENGVSLYDRFKKDSPGWNGLLENG